MTVLTAEEAKKALNGISSRPFQSDVLSAEEAKKALRSVPKSDNREPRTYTVSKPQEPKVYRRNADGLMTQVVTQPTVKQQKQAENAARLDALASRSQTGAQKDLLAPISRTQAIRDFTTGDIVQTVVPKAQSAKQSGGLLAGIQNLMEAASPVAKGVDMLRYLQNQEQAKAQADGIADQRIMELREQAKTNPEVLHSDEYIKAMSRPVSLFSGMVRDIPQIDPEGKSSLDRLAPVMQSKRAEAQNELLEGKTGLGKMGTQALIAGADMLGSAGLAGMTGVPFLGVMAGQSGADAGQRALEEGHSYDKAALFAAGTGGITAGIESFGGAAGKWGDDAARALAKTKIGQAVLSKVPAAVGQKLSALASSKLGKIATDALSEGSEEFAEYYAQNFFENLMLDKDTPYDVRVALESAAVGSMFGGMFGGGRAAADLFTGRNVNAQAAQPAQENIFTQQAGTDANAAQSAAQAGSAGHTPEMQRTIAEYQAAVDPGVVSYATGILQGSDNTGKAYQVGRVSERAGAELNDILGFDPSGFEISLNPASVIHINNRHGLNGNADRSMADIRDLARIGYVLENYDSVRKDPTASKAFSGRDGKGAPKVVYQKRVDGTYYVVEAVPDSKAHKVHVVSAFIEKANQQAPLATAVGSTSDNAPAGSQDLNWLFANGLQLPKATSKTDPINITLPQQADGVNTSIPGSGAENSRRPGLRSTNPDVQAMMDAQGRIQVARRTQRVFDMLGKKLGVNIVVDARGNGENGYYDSQTRTIHLNADSKDPLGQVFSHEVTHRLKEASSADYLAFAQLAEEQLRRTGEYDSLASRIRDAYGELSPDALADEMVAHYAQNLVTNIDEFERLAGINRNLAQKLLDWLDEILHQARLSLQGLTTDEQDAIFRRYTFNEVADATKAWKEVLRRADAGAQGSGEIRRMFVLANDAEAIARAEQMEREGKPPEEIWRETHMGRDIKNNWITEIVDREEDFRESGDANRAKYTDNEARINELWAKKDSLTEAEKAELGRLVRENSKRGKMLLDYVSNRQLQENVPGLEKTRFRKGKLDGGSLGSYNVRTDGITVADGLTGEEFREVVAHETQHAVQEKQDMANGTDTRSALAWWLSAYYETVKDNPAFRALQTPQERFDYLLSPAKKRFGTSDIDMIALQLYKSNYGEQQARNTTSRIGMTEQQRFESMPQYENEWYSDGGDILKARTVLKNIGLPIDYLDRILYSGGKGVHHDGRRESNDTGRAGTVQAERRRRVYHENMGAEPGFQGSLRANEKGQILGQDSVRYSKPPLDSLSQLAYNGKKGGEFDENGANRRLAGWTDRAGDTGRGGGIRGNRPQTSSQISTPYTRAAGGAAETGRNQSYVQGLGEWNAPAEAGRGPLRHNLLTEDGQKYSRPLASERDQEAVRMWKEMGTESPRFKDFYSGNVRELYNSDGSPKVVYHGTGELFNSFSPDRKGSLTRAESAKLGYFFTSSPLVAQGYAFVASVPQRVKGTQENSGVVMPCYLSMKNPLIVDMREYFFDDLREHYSDIIRMAKQQNRDGVILKYANDGISVYTERSDVFVVFDPSQIKSADRNTGTFSSDTDDMRYSRSLAPELAEEYGTIEPGEHPTNDVLLPRKDGSGSPVRRTYRTAAESQHADERMQAEIEQVIRDGAASYQVSGDREAADYAEATLSREGFDGARGRWNAALESGKTNKNDIVLGERLFKEAGSRGDYRDAMEILGQLSAEATIAGQKVQAIRLIKRMGPAGELLTLEQTVRKIQKEIEPQAKKLQKKNDGEINRLGQETRKAKEEAGQAGDAQQKKAIEREIARMEKRMAELKGEITIPDEVVADIMSQKTQKGLDEAMTRAYAEIGKQVPSNWANKWNAWRFMAMLVNPTTHIRNITGNLFFRPAIALKDAIKIPMERALMPRYKGDPTAAFLTGSQTDKGYLAQGRESFEENRRMLMSSGKYNPSNEIRDNMRIFKNGVLEAIRRRNGGALEAEDLVFLRRSYERAYAQVLKANDYAAQDGARQAEIRKQAESWAAEEAWRATYRDASAIADAISRFSRKNAAAALVTEGLFPFKKTPINVAKRGLSYSPAGLVKGLYDMTYGVKSGKVDAAHAIDQFASGLSGTAIVALGAYLASQGLLNGAGDDDDKARAYRKQVSGYQQYSLQIGDKVGGKAAEWLSKSDLLSPFAPYVLKIANDTYTIDWLAPSSMPLFVGAELWKLKQGEAASFKDFYEAMKTLPSPMVEMSMLSSLEDAIDAASYGRSGGEKLVNFFGDAVGSYFGQAVPTLGGKINRIIDGTQRNAYYKDKTAPVPSDWVVAYNSTIRQKVPGMSKGLEPKLDVWGREQKEGLGERIAENLVSPGYLSHSKETPVDKEILRLYEKTGESSVIPNTSPNKYFNAKGSLPRYDMSAAEYTAYMRVRGTTSYELINQMISSSAYKKMGDEEKAKMIGELYQYAGEIAKRRIAPKYADKGMDKAIEICTKANLTYGQYLTVRAQADTDGNHSVSQEEAKKAIDASGLSRKQKSAMWQSFNSKWKNNPYQ